MAGRLAEHCTSKDECVDLRVNGDRVSLVSVEQLNRYGWTDLVEGMPNAERERQLPADLRLPRSHVLVHDANGAIFSPCELFCVRWHPGARKPLHPDDVRTARAYFGEGKQLRRGRVDVPSGKWLTRSRIAVIRYHREEGPTPDHVGDFEHRYDPPIRL